MQDVDFVVKSLAAKMVDELTCHIMSKERIEQLMQGLDDFLDGDSEAWRNALWADVASGYVVQQVYQGAVEISNSKIALAALYQALSALWEAWQM